MTLRERLAALFPEASGHRLKRWLATGRVRVNERTARDGRVPVSASDAVRLGPATGRVGPVALAGGIRLLHEDEHILVIDKPPGLLTIATEREHDRTAYRIVRDYLARRAAPARVFIVHRLDRDTSGLLVLARTPAAKHHLQAQFEARTVERVYRAVVEGTVRSPHGTLTSRLVEERSLRVRSVPPVRRSGPLPDAGARDAITHYRVLARRPRTTLLELTLGTGRRRQIRVQLAEMGHPVVGDRSGGPAAGGRPGRRAEAPGRPRRLLLHALRLAFVHPGTGEPARFESQPPPVFAV